MRTTSPYVQPSLYHLAFDILAERKIPRYFFPEEEMAYAPPFLLRFLKVKCARI
ncbi:MAG: hypothetical protein WC477_00430 [Patescibacteria group bacterium]